MGTRTGTSGDLTPGLVVDARAELGESPTWDARIARLLWVDILRGNLHSTDTVTGATTTTRLPSAIGAVAPRAAGGYLAALANGLWILGNDIVVTDQVVDMASLRRAADIEPGANTRFNDGKVDPAGRFWVGTMSDGGEPQAGSLFRVDRDGRVTTMLTGVSVSNGLGWSPDGSTMYYVDSPTQRIDAFDFDADSGSISRRRPLIEFPVEQGTPDGICVDRDGGIWIALYGAGIVQRCLPDGTLDDRVIVPASAVTSCGFGGRHLEDLYITTARIGLGHDELSRTRTAGGLFRVRPRVAGLPTHPFAG